jgi:hypothetical protein
MALYSVRNTARYMGFILYESPCVSLYSEENTVNSRLVLLTDKDSFPCVLPLRKMEFDTSQATINYVLTLDLWYLIE